MKSYFNLWKSTTNINTFSQTVPRSFVKAEEKFKIIEKEKALEILLNVLEMCRCEACELVLTHPTAVCEGGHIICNSCRPKATVRCVCPACAKPFLENEHSTLTSAVLLIPYECRHSGCFTVVIPGDDHELWCGFLDTSCKLCNWVGARRDIVRHVRCSHKLNATKFQELTFLGQLKNFDAKENRIAITPILVGNDFIWSETKIMDGGNEFEKNYVFVPDGKTVTSISVEVVFGSKDSITKELSSQPIFSLTASSRNSIIFPGTVLRQNTDQNKTLHWKEVFTSESPILENNELQELAHATSKHSIKANQETQLIQAQENPILSSTASDITLSLRKDSEILCNSNTNLDYKPSHIYNLDGTVIEELNSASPELTPFSPNSLDIPIAPSIPSPEPICAVNVLRQSQLETDALNISESDDPDSNTNPDSPHTALSQASGSRHIRINKNRKRTVGGVDLSIFDQSLLTKK